MKNVTLKIDQSI